MSDLMLESVIELPSFTGIQSDWPVFYETFKSLIHDNPDVDKVNKLHYLLGKLSGKALTTCSGITPTAVNYDLIWNALVKKYEDKRALANCYMDQLMNFKPAHVENYQCLNAFLEKFDTAVKALKNLEIENLPDFMLSYLALSKIDEDTAKLFEMSHRKDTQPAYNEVLKFVQEQCKILSLNDEPADKSNSTGPKQRSSSTFGSQAPRAFVVHSNNNYTSTSQYNANNNCSFCSKSHALFTCDKFMNLTPKDRFNYAKEKSLCLNCLSSLHKVINCKSKNSCRTCGLRHHSLLHWTSSHTLSRPAQSKEAPVENSPNLEPKSERDTTSFCSTASHNQTVVLLSTAIVRLILPNGKGHNIRVLIDNGSQSNFLTSKCCKKLGIPAEASATTVLGMGRFPQKIAGRAKNLIIASRFNTSIKYPLEALIVDRITDKMPSAQVDISALEFLEGLPIADDTFSVPGEVDGILGAEIFSKILGSSKFSDRFQSIHAIETALGYVITGRTQALSFNSTQTFCSFVEPITDLVKKWEIEQVDGSSSLSREDEECEQHFSATHKRDDSGRYVVRLPFRDNPQALGDSYTTASRRFFGLEKRFESSADFKRSYCDAIREQINSGYVSPVLEEKAPSLAYYIPHHGVCKPGSVSTTLRIVLDASAKTNRGVSLNEILHKGPNLQADITTVLLNFRLFEIAMTADLKKMFLQILVAPEDRDFQRILWRSSTEEPLAIYRLNRVAFGLRCSPYLALRTVKQLAIDESNNCTEASKAVLYLAEAQNLYTDLVQLFSSGGFSLVKWNSNSLDLLLSIPEDDRLSRTLEFDATASIVLGLQWHSVGDFFGFRVAIPDATCTKRNVLSTIARFYDPLGFLAPVIFYGKLLIREFWKCKLDWDSSAPPYLKLLWSQLYDDLHLLRNVGIPRHLFAQENVHIQLFGFADASEKGYEAVVYMKVILSDDKVKTSFVCAKSKVAPLKIISIPRLELCAALLLSQLLNLIIETFRLRVVINHVSTFSDSMIVLHWIRGAPTRWNSFVANRVAKIQNLVATSQWFHVNGVDNPADCLSRGLTPAQLLENFQWFSGPAWLMLDKNAWPIRDFLADESFALERKKRDTFCAIAAETNENTILQLINRISDFEKLLRIVVHILRFLRLSKRKAFISASDLEVAEMALWRVVQRACFADEFALLEGNKCSPVLRNLNPFLHEGLIRVGGRLTNSDLDYNQRHPVVLPKSHGLVAMLIDYFHRKNFHAGPQLLLSLLRQRYWILSARSAVRKRIHLCNLCFRFKPRSSSPMMRDLPAPRVTEARAFCHTGVDYAGPFSILLTRKRGVKTQKAYICLFVCFTTRALHLEVASDLSTDIFLAALKRFLARLGPCSVIHSDMGTNFQGAKTTLDNLYSFVRSDQFTTAWQKELLKNRIEWNFNPPSAPHFGGLWEAGVKAVKTHLHKAIGSQILSYEEFATVLTQIECLLNSRPLCWLSTDPSEPLPLTPAHFLTLTPLQSLPAENMLDTPINRLSRKELLDQIVQSYWKRWSLEYLNTLQARQKWNTSGNPVTPGTLVLVQQDNLPPLSWPCGIIEEVFPGKDGVIRVATVRLKGSIYRRPVVKLYPLPSQ